MSQSSQRIVGVFGATGRQGGAVLRALAAGNEFKLRAITRNPSGDSAKKLLASIPAAGAANVSVVAADMNDESSVIAALAGVWGVFMVTSFNPYMKSQEEQQAKSVANCAVKAGVKFFAFSSLVNAKTISGGLHHVEHFTAKHNAETYIRTLPFADGVVFPYAGMFASNFLTMMKPQKNAKDNIYEFISILRSDIAVPLTDIEEEFGAAVKKIFLNPEKYNKQIVLTGTYITLPQLAELFTKELGKPARYVQLPLEMGKNFGEEINDMLQFFNNFGYYGGQAINNITDKTDIAAFWKKNANQFF